MEGKSIQGHVLTWSPIWDCTCLDLLRSLQRVPQAPPVPEGEGSIVVWLLPPWAHLQQKQPSWMLHLFKPLLLMIRAL